MQDHYFICCLFCDKQWRSKSRGNISKRLSPNNVTFADFVNPWNFYSEFFQDKPTVHQWMFDRGLLRDNVRCHHCDVSSTLQQPDKGTDGYVWRCTKNRLHDTGMRKFSFFDRSHFPFADLMQFIKSLVDGVFAPHVDQHGMDCKASVDWASFCRELAVEYLYRDVLDRDEAER